MKSITEGCIVMRQRTGSSSIIMAKRLLVVIVFLGIPLCLVFSRLIELTTATIMDDEDRTGYASFESPLISRTKTAAAVASNETITATVVSKKNKIFPPKSTISQAITPAKNVEDGVSDMQGDSSATGKNNKPTVKDFSRDRDFLKPLDSTILSDAKKAVSSSPRNQKASSHNDAGALFDKTTDVGHKGPLNRSNEVQQHKEGLAVLKSRTETDGLVHHAFHNSNDDTPNATMNRTHTYVRYHPSYEIVRQQVDDGNLTAGQFILDFAIIGFPKCGTSTMSKYVCMMYVLADGFTFSLP
jgi:hypothetical protein